MGVEHFPGSPGTYGLAYNEASTGIRARREFLGAMVREAGF